MLRRALRFFAPLPSFVGVRSTVRGKLMRVVLTTTLIALCVAGIAMLTVDLTRYQKSWASDLSTEASILAVSIAPALAFNDHEGAVRNLAALKARPRVTAAALYRTDGSVYASFMRDGALPLPSQVPAEGIRTSGQRVEYAHVIERNGEVLGTLYLRARYDTLGRVAAYLGIFALVTLFAVAVAFLWSRQLQRGITEPLDAMVALARAIVTRRDYSLRVEKTTDDEIGVVVDAFNNMLEEVGTRSSALEESNRALEDSNRALLEEVEVRKSTQAALDLATARLESTLAAAEIGTWFWDIVKNDFTADRNLTALYGLDERALNGPPDLHYRHIHPDDLLAVQKSERDALNSGVFASTEFRVKLANGTEKWMARRGKVQMDEKGKAVFMSGLLIDITAQREAEKALRTSEKLYRAIGESINYGVWVCDRQGRNVYASESFLQLIGFTQEQCSNLGWAEALHPDDARATIAAWEETVRSGTVWYREHRIRGQDGRYHAILAQGVPIRGEDGEISGWAGINLDISRLKSTEEALRSADRRKDEFLATLAHELRNPLAPVRHAVKVLESKTLQADQDQWARDVIARQVRRMALLLDDLLDVSRITQGRLDLKIETVSLNSIIDAAVETARPLIDAKRHRLTIALPEEPLMLMVDPLRMSQSLSNLLTNSAKYTDDGGQITLSVALSTEEVILSVKDTGIGLEPAAVTGLFEMFSQVRSAIARSEGGLGIGLALVKGLIQLHGGTIDARSPGAGLGSEFRIHLPRSLVASLTIKARQDSPAPSDPPRLGHRVLLADDNRDAADSLAMLLEMNGYSVTVGYNGAEALQLARQSPPQVMILDIGMPDMTGLEVAQHVRAEPWGRAVYLIAVTGWGQKEDKARALASGFDHHLTKPVDPDEVEKVLQAFFSRQVGPDVPAA
jgi:two-component system CheB/CheR fusion protein